MSPAAAMPNRTPTRTPRLGGPGGQDHAAELFLVRGEAFVRAFWVCRLLVWRCERVRLLHRWLLAPGGPQDPRFVYGK